MLIFESQEHKFDSVTWFLHIRTKSMDQQATASFF